ncbi:MAG: hypothetical protein TU35_008350 [Thermoproteus sp. AZ2]|jgi:hypothetical protein|uniref:Uncharacterized protein n=1 Tax=Thermoproteus sp. AZ2 TaxID=1609232 RepID=A0ACC6V2J0_9CREN|nr:MAG: hypothetical protein TU35_03395 [Thermoproteus sp. AZ2]
MLWYPIGKSPPRRYFIANIALINVSKAFMVASFALFLSGLASVGYNVGLHVDLMTLGLLSFYFSVMYLQHPAFTNTMPKPAVSYALAAAFILGALGYAFKTPFLWLPFSALYIAIYAPGFRGQNALPNALVVAGLIALALAAEPWRLALSFPAASALSLIMRVDNSKRRKRIETWRALAFSAIYLALYFSPIQPAIAIAAIFAAFLALNGVYVSREPYSWGTIIGRALPLLSPLGLLGAPTFHFLYLGISVIMFSLCVPWFNPSVFLRRVPSWPPYLPGIAAAAAALRLVDLRPLLPLSALIYIGLGIYVAVKILREPSFPLGKPPPQ